MFDVFDLRAFSRRNRRLSEAPNGFKMGSIDRWSLGDWMVAACGELGEAANVVKKLKRASDGLPGNKKTEAELREQLGEELGDAAVILDIVVQRAGFDLATLLDRKYKAMCRELNYEDATPGVPA